MSGHRRRGSVLESEVLTLATTIPADLIALELHRREVKVRTKPDRCRYQLYLAEKAISRHEWITARRSDWRAARKALKYVADQEEQRA